MEIVIEKNVPVPATRKPKNDGMMKAVRAMQIGDCATVAISDISSFKVSMFRAFGSGSYRMQLDNKNEVCRFWRVS